MDWNARSLLRSSIWCARRTSRRRSATCVDRGLRVHTADEAQLGGVHVADAGEVALVEQRVAQRAVRLGQQAAYGLVGVPVGAEQVRAEVTDGRLLGVALEELDDAEREAHRDLVGGGEDDPGLVGGAWPALAGRRAPARRPPS